MKVFKAFLLACACLIPLSSFAEPVNINTASVEELSSALKGVGPAKAHLIVAYRENHGPFTDAAQLENVKGIGATTVAKNLDNIFIETEADAK